MIKDRQSFTYKDKTIVEKAVFSTPYRHEGVFPNEGCFLYIKGEGARLMSSDDNQPVNSQEAVLLKCGTYFLDMVKEAEQDEMEVIAFHLYPDIIKQLFEKELPVLIEMNTGEPKTHVVVPEDTITQFIGSLEFYFQHPEMVSESLIELKIKELILLLVQTNNVGSILELVKDLYSSRDSHLQKVIELHLFSNLSLEELAKLCNLSLSSFKREFKKAYDDSPANYILTAKLNKAKELLATSDFPVNEIAYEIGFNDPLYFTRIFSKKIGVSPSHYRKEHV